MDRAWVASLFKMAKSSHQILMYYFRSSRSSDVAKGGARGGLRSRVGLYRRGASGGHTEPLPRGARVPIGELLMLRAQIEPEDGELINS